MRIEPSNPQTNLDAVQNATASRSNARSSEAAAGTTESTAFKPTSDYLRMLQAVRELPEVRSDIVDEVSTRLQAGEIDSPQAAADAAQNILDLAQPGE